MDTDATRIHPNGTKEWRQNGLLHRDGDQPAVIWFDGTRLWYYRNGCIHRNGDKPAVITMAGNQWWKNGQLHRDGLPAIIGPNNTLQWWFHGHRVTRAQSEWLALRRRARAEQTIRKYLRKYKSPQ
jgi:hypothetical protein